MSYESRSRPSHMVCAAAGMEKEAIRNKHCARRSPIAHGISRRVADDNGRSELRGRRRAPPPTYGSLEARVFIVSPYAHRPSGGLPIVDICYKHGYCPDTDGKECG